MFNAGNKKFEIKKKIRIIFLFFIILLFALSVRLYYIQKIYNPIVNTTSEGNYIQKENLSEYNYLLLDRNRKDLLNYNTKYKLAIDTRSFKLNSTNKNLQNLIAFNYIMKSEDSKFSFDDIIKVDGKLYYDISEENFNKIKELDSIKGVYVYTYKERAKEVAWKIENIISSTRAFDPYNKKDDVLKKDNSLEMVINQELSRNKNPKIVFEKDMDGIYKENGIEPLDNNLNIILTLDSDLQERIRNILNQDKYKEFNNIGAVLIEGETGKILSLVQKDESQPNIVLGSGGINGYEPGSIFKILTVEAAMEYHNVKPTDKFTCTGVICAKNKVHGLLSVSDAVKVSCNDIAAKLGEMVGKEELIDFAKKQGIFNQILGLDGQTGMESSGSLPPQGASAGIISMGQSFQSTLLQMTGTITTIVNNGEYIKPYIVDSFENNKGEQVKIGKIEKNKIISKSVAEDLKMMLKGTVAKGTAQIAKIDGVEIGAKTGTAEAVHDNSHGWFIGYFKDGNKYYALGVFVPNIGDENSKGQKTGGGNTAGPVFKDIVSEVIKK